MDLNQINSKNLGNATPINFQMPAMGQVNETNQSQVAKNLSTSIINKLNFEQLNQIKSALSNAQHADPSQMILLNSL